MSNSNYRHHRRDFRPSSNSLDLDFKSRDANQDFAYNRSWSRFLVRYFRLCFFDFMGITNAFIVLVQQESPKCIINLTFSKAEIHLGKLGRSHYLVFVANYLSHVAKLNFSNGRCKYTPGLFS